jgi:hypothetical protein
MGHPVIYNGSPLREPQKPSLSRCCGLIQGSFVCGLLTRRRNHVHAVRRFFSPDTDFAMDGAASTPLRYAGQGFAPLRRQERAGEKELQEGIGKSAGEWHSVRPFTLHDVGGLLLVTVTLKKQEKKPSLARAAHGRLLIRDNANHLLTRRHTYVVPSHKICRSGK